jgi:hypothetical protein
MHDTVEVELSCAQNHMLTRLLYLKHVKVKDKDVYKV